MRRFAAGVFASLALLAACVHADPLITPAPATTPSAGSGATANAQAHVVAAAAATISRRVTAYATGDGSADEPWTEWEDAFDDLALDKSYDIVFDPGFYTQDVDIGLPVNMTGSLVIRGEGRPTITLGRASYFVAPVKIADFDVWRNVMIDGLTIDVNNKGGRVATIGGYLRGPRTANLSKENIVLSHVTISRQLLDYDDTVKNHRGAVHLLADATPDAAQPVFVRNVVIENSSFAGGNWGVLITGSNRNPPREVIENITIRNVLNDERPAGGRVQRRSFPSSCFHVGQDAGVVDGIAFENLTCLAPGDNCFEINNARRAHMTGLTCYNPIITGFTLKNFQPVADPAKQLYEVRDAKVVVDADYPNGVGPYALVAASGDGFPFGTLNVERFAHVYDGVRQINPANASFLLSDRPIRQVTLRDVDIAGSWNTQQSESIFGCDVLSRGHKHDWDGDGIADLPRLTIDRMRSYHTMTGSTDATVKRGIYIEGDQDFAITDYNLRVRGGSAREITGLFVGGSTTGSKSIRGTVSRMHADLLSTTPHAARVVMVTGKDQITPKSLVIEDVTAGPGTEDGFIDPSVRSEVSFKRPQRK